MKKINIVHLISSLLSTVIAGQGYADSTLQSASFQTIVSCIPQLVKLARWARYALGLQDASWVLLSAVDELARFVMMGCNMVCKSQGSL